MRRLYLLRVWLCVMLFLVFVFELCSQISIWGTLARLLTVKLEEHFLASSLIKFTLLSTAFIIKILIEHVGGFSYRSSTSYIIFAKLHNLFEHNTDYLMSCPTGLLLCMPSSSSNLMLHVSQSTSFVERCAEVWIQRSALAMPLYDVTTWEPRYPYSSRVYSVQ